MVEVSELLKPDTVIAVVGASRHKEKYGYKVYAQLLKEEYEAYPINPNADEIDGHKVYHSLAELPKKTDLVITVVPPAVTEKLLPEVKKEGIRYVWMQPGSESGKALQMCKELGLECIHDLCYIQNGLKVEFSV